MVDSKKRFDWLAVQLSGREVSEHPAKILDSSL